ncbi:hypothetical protein [Pseudovibrio japonicus]|nr:hypothetical protein [Pseudovibrio japonicus]
MSPEKLVTRANFKETAVENFERAMDLLKRIEDVGTAINKRDLRFLCVLDGVCEDRGNPNRVQVVGIISNEAPYLLEEMRSSHDQSTALALVNTAIANGDKRGAGFDAYGDRALRLLEQLNLIDVAGDDLSITTRGELLVAFLADCDNDYKAARAQLI